MNMAFPRLVVAVEYYHLSGKQKPRLCVVGSVTGAISPVRGGGKRGKKKKKDPSIAKY